MSKTLGLGAGLLVAGLLVAGCSSEEPEPAASSAGLPQLPAQTTQALESQLAKTVARNDVPGAAVEVCIPGYEDWTAVQGVADLEQGVPMTADLVWPIRSVTKSVTVTLILQLVDEGKASLDDTIDQWVPGVPNGDEITLRQLADMSSGAPEYTTQAWIEDYIADPQRAFTTGELIDYALAEPAQFPPGTEKVYTNTNTLLLGEVVAQEYGQPFDQVVTEQIIEPLGLDGTTYVTAVDDWSGPHPTGYQTGGVGPWDPASCWNRRPRPPGSRVRRWRRGRSTTSTGRASARSRAGSGTPARGSATRCWS